MASETIRARRATFWHVTPKENVASILADGLLPGWGDAGLGVYVWAELGAAEDYRAGGGWDGEAAPGDLAIIELECDQGEIEFVIPDPGWPNPEAYEHVRMWPAPDDDIAWRPHFPHRENGAAQDVEDIGMELD